ncbi:hypothetical protein [Metabacillus fastidiosus]|uniref:hypothetical protein n=1 Tax=Metabacillus fastidiosus TaxID=1458 RepID=UPI002DC03CF2|nr:hypothetical protein [Metabacillus fastidiosus]MEC2075126.1 hypothetical protein [Metabacillus fastidiosus]
MSCKKGDRESEIQYIQAFPREDSPALTEFMNDYITGSFDTRLFKENEMSILTVKNKNSDQNKIIYYQYQRHNMEQYYKPILNTKDPFQILRDLKSTDKLEKTLLMPVKDPFEYNLPLIIMEKNNELKIRTKFGEKVISLPNLMEKYNIKETDEIAFDVVQSNKGYFTLLILDEDAMNSKGQKLYLTFFIKQDLSKMVMSESFDKAVQEKLDKGDLDSFFSDFQKIDDTGKYAFLYGQTIVDMKTKKIVEIKKEDYLSNDGKYVYINGRQDTLEDGIQKIQRIENYAAGNEIYETEFKLDYKEIAKELDLVISGIGIAEINYFNKDYVVLNLEYNAKFVGTAGGTNVIIDLQKSKENPVFYLVNLELNIEIRDWLVL